MKVKLLSYTKNPELLIATAAKLCYSSSDIESLFESQSQEQVEKFISKLEELGHESPFEHASFTFAIEDVSRVLEQQLTRHRIASYSIQSGRYVNRENASFYLPGNIKKVPEATDIYMSVLNSSKEAYANLVKELTYHYIIEHSMINNSIPEKIISDKSSTIEYFKENYKSDFRVMSKQAIESARFVFPSSLHTKIIVTMNVRTLWNFFKHRLCFRAQDEIRQCASLMLKEVRAVAPNLFRHSGAPCVTGICPEGIMQCSQLKGKIPTTEQVNELIKKYYKNGQIV